MTRFYLKREYTGKYLDTKSILNPKSRKRLSIDDSFKAYNPEGYAIFCLEKQIAEELAEILSDLYLEKIIIESVDLC
jgi:hypothetical protein